MLIFHVEEKLDHIDVDFEGFGRLLRIAGLLALPGGRLGGRGRLGRSGLGSRGRLLGRDHRYSKAQQDEGQYGQDSALQREKFWHSGFPDDSLLV